MWHLGEGEQGLELVPYLFNKSVQSIFTYIIMCPILNIQADYFQVLLALCVCNGRIILS